MATMTYTTNDDERYPDADELREAGTVSLHHSDHGTHGNWTAALAGDVIGQWFGDEFAALESLRGAMNTAGYFPNVYSINERGNIDLMSYDARSGGWTVARGWV